MTKDLYVKNIPLESTEEDVRRLFSVAGKVSYIHMVTDPATGQFKGCGYVKMASEAEAKDAINCLDGARLEHCTLSVTEARPQAKAPGGKGRGEGGRGEKKPGGKRG